MMCAHNFPPSHSFSQSAWYSSPPPAAAQGDYGVPSITLTPSTNNPPSGCNPLESGNGYTCTPDLTVRWHTPGLSCTPPACHVEYCLIDSSATNSSGVLTGCRGHWKHHNLTYTLPAAPDCPSPYPPGQYCVWAQYRTDSSTSIGYVYSPPSTSPATITLNDNGPTANLNSPAGILDPVNYPSLCLANAQYVNYDVSQWITYSGASNAIPPETFTFTIDGCSSSCSGITGASGLSGTSTMWEWPSPSSQPGHSYLQITALDYSGNYMSTQPPSSCSGGATQVFTLYSGNTNPQEVDCYGGNTSTTGPNNAIACTVIADQVNVDIPNDPPAISYESPFTSCSGGGPIAFSGYSDPSIRRDPMVSSLNPYATNLWMMYSYPWYWQTGTQCGQANPLTYTPAVAIHMAQSTTSAPDDLAGGTDWSAYCNQDECTVGTPVWPTEPFCNASSLINPVTLPYSPPGSPITESCTAQCWSAPHDICFSWHEVANMWPDPSTGNWYAVHLMYYVPYGSGINPSVIYDGCLVLSMADAAAGNTQPTGLGWSAGVGPQDCAVTPFPSNNAALTWNDLSAAVVNADQPNPGCNTWGEPAIMVTPGSDTAYLATSCLDTYGEGKGYYFFQNQFNGNEGDFLDYQNWTYLSGPFNLTNNTIPPSAYPPSTPPPSPPYTSASQPADSVTEFDWASRPDGTMMAILTLAYVPDPNNDHYSTNPYQYGCAAVAFDIQNTANPFGSVLAAVTDINDGSSSDPTLSEQQGPSGCTYDPASNTGILIVRHLIDASVGVQYQLYSILDTGVLP